jgi:hypothetical protein
MPFKSRLKLVNLHSPIGDQTTVFECFETVFIYKLNQLVLLYGTTNNNG